MKSPSIIKECLSGNSWQRDLVSSIFPMREDVEAEEVTREAERRRGTERASEQDALAKRAAEEDAEQAPAAATPGVAAR